MPEISEEKTTSSISPNEEDNISLSTTEVVTNTGHNRSMYRATWKNIIIISFIFLLIYTSYTGLFALQSSLHSQAGTGVISTSIRFIALVLSGMFLPEFLIHTVGHKWTISMSLISFALWMAANGYSSFATMVPASILNGIFAGSLWAAQGSYFTELAKDYAIYSKKSHEGVTSLFFGVFFAFYLGASIPGSIISTTMLKISPMENLTLPGSEEVQRHCGPNNCPWSEYNITTEDKPDYRIVWTLLGVYIGIAVCAIALSVVVVDNLPKHLTVDNKSKPLNEKFKHILLSAMRLTTTKELWLLVPLTVYTGIEETYFFAEYNYAWVSCALGIWMIGYVNVPFGLSSAIMSYFSGYMANSIGRIPVMCIALVLDISTQLTLVFWVPVSSLSKTSWIYYLISLVWGTYHGVWLTLTTALYGIVFPNDTGAAYSNYMVFQCLGYAIAFGYSFVLCSSIKLYIMSGSLLIAIICYFILEARLNKEKIEIII